MGSEDDGIVHDNRGRSKDRLPRLWLNPAVDE